MSKISDSIIAVSADSTKEYARRFGRELKPGTWLGLYGDLGAGKTTFVQGLAEGLGIEDVVQSPTFVIMKEYRGKRRLVHIDLYRIDGDEIDGLGMEDHALDDAIVAVEWAEKLPEAFKRDLVRVEFKVKSPDVREIKVKGLKL